MFGKIMTKFAHTVITINIDLTAGPYVVG